MLFKDRDPGLQILQLALASLLLNGSEVYA